MSVFLSLEEAEPDHYEQLKCPTEDVYVKASDIHPIVKSKEGMSVFSDLIAQLKTK